MRHILFLAVLAVLSHAGRAADLRGALRGGNLARGGARDKDEAPMGATAPLMDVDGTDLPEATATGAEGGATGPEMAHIASRAPASAGKVVASREIANGDQKKFTYIDRSGSFPGLGHCVDGILRAHLQARDANIRVAELSTYMLEYCEEDIATALGVSLAPAEGSAAAWDLATTPVQRENSAKEGEMTGTASQVMAALQHRLKEQPSAGLQQEQHQAPPAVVVVTRRHSVVRVPERGDSTKMKMVRRMCSRLSTLYTPKCCAEHKPCCSSEWRARFAQRSDALRYCYLVRDAVEGRFAQAMRRVNSEADALEERAQMPSSNKAQFTPVNPDCLAGGRKEFSLECGHLGDGSKLQTDGGRSLPSFREQGLRVEIMHEVEQRLLARSEIFKSLDSKLKEVLTLRNRKVKPATVDFELKFTTDGILDAADREDTTSVGASSLIEEIMSTKNSFGALPGTVARIKRAVATSLYRMRDDLVAVGSIERACPKSHPCEPYGTSVHGEGMVDHVAHVRLQFTGGNERALRVSKTLGTSIYTKTLQAALTKELPDKEGGGDYPIFAFASVTDVKIHVGEEQEPPAWYRAQLDAKVSAARQERNAAYECKLMAKQLVSLSRRKSDDSIEVAVLKESGKANQAQSLDDRIERLGLEIRITDLNLTLCDVQMQLRATSMEEQEQELTHSGGVSSSVLSHRDALVERAASLEHEMESVVQQGRLHASLGALSAKASQLAAQADTEQSILKRARVEAKLAELNMMRQQIIAQLSSDKKHAERMAILRKAIARDPHNEKLRHRLKHDEMEEQERRELLLHVARSGDTCGPCRARVMSVMEGAVRNGFEERHLPDYMQSFCEVRLALTGPSTVLRSQEDISKVCLNFRTNLEHDLAESVTQQLEAEHRDGHQLSPRETDSPKRLADGSAKPVRIRLKSSEGHNATVHAFCMATSDCMGSARDRDASATLRGHPRNPAMSKCDMCASSLMGKVADWRDAETLRLREGGVDDQLPFDGLLKKWCVDRLEQSWALRKDLIADTCASAGEEDARMLGDSGSVDAAPRKVFDAASWDALPDDDARAHRDLVQLFGVCEVIGECPRHTAKAQGASSDEKRLLKSFADKAIAEKKATAAAEAALKRADEMAIKAEEKESKTEETAEEQHEAEERCTDALRAVREQESSGDLSVDRVCAEAMASERNFERISTQYLEHKKQVEILGATIEGHKDSCKQAREDATVAASAAKREAKTALMQCVTQSNSELAALDKKEATMTAKGANAGGASGVELAEMDEAKARLEKKVQACEQAQVSALAKAEAGVEMAISDCNAKLGTLVQTRVRASSLVAETNTAKEGFESTYVRLNAKCVAVRKVQQITVDKRKKLERKCKKMEDLAEATKKTAAMAAAAAAAVEVAKEIAQEKAGVSEANRENAKKEAARAVAEISEDADATGGAATSGAATGGAATGATGPESAEVALGMNEEGPTTDDDEPEPSASADTIGRCALDVEQHVRSVRRKGLKHRAGSGSSGRSIGIYWPVVASWAMNFCEAEAEAAKSRAALVGTKLRVDVASACAYASQVFVETAPLNELDAAVEFCKTLRQFTGKPLASVKYDRHADHGLLPKAPITLRHELSVPTRMYTFGPAPIERHRDRSDLESFATPDEVRVQAKKHFGPGNMDAVTAAEVADMAAKGSAMTGASSSGVDGGGDARTVQSLEDAFAKKWKAAAVQRGVVFSHVDEPLVGEPNRQLKVPVPQHRVVNQTTDVKLDGSPVQEDGIVTGDYVAGGAASLLAGNVTKTKAALR